MRIAVKVKHRHRHNQIFQTQFSSPMRILIPLRIDEIKSMLQILPLKMVPCKIKLDLCNLHIIVFPPLMTLSTKDRYNIIHSSKPLLRINSRET